MLNKLHLGGRTFVEYHSPHQILLYIQNKNTKTREIILTYEMLNEALEFSKDCIKEQE